MNISRICLENEEFAYFLMILEILENCFRRFMISIKIFLFFKGYLKTQIFSDVSQMFIIVAFTGHQKIDNAGEDSSQK